MRRYVEMEYKCGKVLQRRRGSGGNVRLSTDEFLVNSLRVCLSCQIAILQYTVFQKKHVTTFLMIS